MPKTVFETHKNKLYKVIIEEREYDSVAIKHLISITPMKLLINEFIKLQLKKHPINVNFYIRFVDFGLSIGIRLLNRFFSQNKLLLKNILVRENELELVRFICVDYYLLMFNRTISNLKTNHNGVYVLVDESNNFVISNINENKIDLIKCHILKGLLKAIFKLCGNKQKKYKININHDQGNTNYDSIEYTIEVMTRIESEDVSKCIVSNEKE